MNGDVLPSPENINARRSPREPSLHDRRTPSLSPVADMRLSPRQSHGRKRDMFKKNSHQAPNMPHNNMDMRDTFQVNTDLRELAKQEKRMTSVDRNAALRESISPAEVDNGMRRGNRLRNQWCFGNCLFSK